MDQISSTLPQRRTREETKLVENMIAEAGGVSNLLELFYWTQEESILEAVRSLVSMSAVDRDRLVAFLALAEGNCTVKRVNGAALELHATSQSLRRFRRDDDRLPN